MDADPEWGSESNDVPGDFGDHFKIVTDADLRKYVESYYGLEPETSGGSITTMEKGLVRSVCLRLPKTCKDPFERRVYNSYQTLPTSVNTVDISQSLKGAFTGDMGPQILPPNLYEIRMGTYVVPDLFKIETDEDNWEKAWYFYYWSRAPELVVKTDTSSLPFIKQIHYLIWAWGFGYGEAVGFDSYVANPDDETKIIRSSTLQLIFDSPFPNKNFQKTFPKYSWGEFDKPYEHYLSLDSFADGTVDNFNPVSEVGMSLTIAYYLRHEAGVKDMKRWLNETNDDIMHRRDAFVTFLGDRFGITIALASDEADAPENEIAGVVPYSGAHISGLRIVSSASGGNENVIPPRQYDNQRLVEVGFRYRVSQDDARGRLDLTPGAVIKQGVCVIENYKDDREESILEVPIIPRIRFETKMPSAVNDVNQASIWEDVYVEAASDNVIKYYYYYYCSGLYAATSLQYPVDRHKTPMKFQIRGTFKFTTCTDSKPIGW